MSGRSTTASVLLTLASLLAGACASSDGSQRSMGFDAAGAAATVAPAATPLLHGAAATSIIMKLRFRDMDLTVVPGPDSPRFAVTARGGTPLAASLDERQLAEQYPDLHELYRSGVALSGPYLDARLDHDFHGQAVDRP